VTDSDAQDRERIAAEAERVGAIREAATNLSAALGHLRAVLATPALRSDPAYVAKAWGDHARRRAEWRAIILGQVDVERSREDVSLPWFREARRGRYRAALDRLEDLAG
jgi:hypothetical protein